MHPKLQLFLFCLLVAGMSLRINGTKKKVMKQYRETEEVIMDT